MKQYLLLLFLLLATTLVSAQNHPTYCGDANNDGSVNVGDIETITKLILEKEEPLKVSYDVLDLKALPQDNVIHITLKDNSVVTIAITDIATFEITAPAGGEDNPGEGNGDNTGEGGEEKPDDGGNGDNPTPSDPEDGKDGTSSDVGGKIDVLPWD